MKDGGKGTSSNEAAISIGTGLFDAIHSQAMSSRILIGEVLLRNGDDSERCPCDTDQAGSEVVWRSPDAKSSDLNDGSDATDDETGIDEI